MSHDLAKRLYEAGCDDSTGSSRDSLCYLGFARMASSFRVAITSAISQVESCGLHVASVEADEDLAEIPLTSDQKTDLEVVNLMLQLRRRMESDHEYRNLWNHPVHAG